MFEYTEPLMPTSTWEMLSSRQQGQFIELVQTGLDSLALTHAKSLPDMVDFLDTMQIAELDLEATV